MKNLTITTLFIMCILNAQPITVTGTVNDKIGNPVEEVTVSYLCDGTDIITPVQTDSTGYFEFTFDQLGIDDNTLPNTIRLGANYPNPFNPGTVIPLSTNKPGLFLIHDLLGRQVQSISIKGAGHFQITWGGKLKSGFPASAGIYFYSFQTDENRFTGKMILMDGGGNTGLSLSGSTGVTHQRQTIRTTTECDNHTMTYSAEHITDVTIDLGETGYTEDTNIEQEVNRGPCWINELPNPYLPEGDTLILNLNEYVYDDGQSEYQVSNPDHFQIIQDSLLFCIVQDSLVITEVIIYDDEDQDLTIANTIQIVLDNTHIFFSTNGDPRGIYVLNPYTTNYVDSLMSQDSIFYGKVTPNETGDIWYAIKTIYHAGQNTSDTYIIWIDVETKEIFLTIEGSNRQLWLEKSHDGSKLITWDWIPSHTFSIYDSETGDFLGGRDTTLRVRLVRTSKAEDVIYIWGNIRNSDIDGDKRIGAWDIDSGDWLWFVTYDSYENMAYYGHGIYYDMAVSYDGYHVFLRVSDSWGNSKFYDINAQTGDVISEHYIYGFNQLEPTMNNQYVYLTYNDIVWANWLEGGGGLARYDIQNNTMEEVIGSLHDLGFDCVGHFGSIFMSVLPDNQTGIIYAGSYCPNDSTWDSHDSIVKIDLENVEFIEGIHMPTTTMPGYNTQHPASPFNMGKYPY